MSEPTDTSGIAGYWDRYAAGIAEETREEALKDAFGWCQYAGHGPGNELLGDPLTTLELGFGRGNAVAALATKGIEATGIDVSPLQCEHAIARWGHLTGAHFVQAEATAYLNDATRQWDAIYSIWGALWFTDPDVLLPLVHERLIPGGRLVFSHAPPVPGAYGVQGMYADGFRGRQVWVYRWAYEPEGWAALLRKHGYTGIEARVEPAPQPDLLGTLIATAHRPR
ncbi:class I SAM-dependent methyltransferase [Salinactinospora qingdaonensis]